MSDAGHLTTPGLRLAASNSSPDADLVSTREAARLLGQNARSVRRAIERGDLPAVKSGSAYRIAADDLMRFAARATPSARSPAGGNLVAFPVALRGFPALPEPLSSFVGRAAEVAQVSALLTDPAVRLLTLTGPGGIGKTRLALAVAAIGDHFPDGVVFVPLASVSRAGHVLPAIFQALGLREVAGHDRQSQLHAFLAGKRLLLVLDNVEHLLEAAPDIAALLRQSRSIALLATSRAPLRVAGEREFPVPPLSLPAPEPSPVDLLASDAARLFVERAQAHDPAFAVDAAVAPHIAEICARLDGLPLAIELAAARAPVLPPRAMRDRLERRLPLLTAGPRDAPRRHRTMRDAIAWSYDQLTLDEQVLFRRLAVFAGGFTLDAAEDVGGDGFAEGGVGFGIGGEGGDASLRGARGRDEQAARQRPPPPGDSPSIFELAGSLHEQSLLTRELGPQGEPRFRMLETVREYGLERLGSEEAEHARAAHAHYFLRHARTLRPFTVMLARQAPMDLMAADDANLRAALNWFDERGLDADVVGMVVACWVYWYAIGRLHEAARWLGRASAKREAASPRDRARLEIATAELLMLKGETAEAEAVFAEGIPLVRATSDPFDLASALISRGASLKFGDQYAEAEIQFAEALSLAETIDVPELREAVAGRALGNLGVVARAQGDLDLALTRCEASLRCYQDLELDLAEAHALVDLGEIAREQGHLRLAVERYVAGMERTSEASEARIFADALTGMADVAAAWGQSRTAVLLFSAAATLRERGGFAMVLPSDAATAERNLAMLRATLGEEAFTSIWAEGRELPLPEVVALATTMAPLPGTPPSEAAQGAVALTRREQDVLRLLADGLTDREIAEALFISPRTVSWHVGAVLGKLQATSRREAAERARAAGLL